MQFGSDYSGSRGSSGGNRFGSGSQPRKVSQPKYGSYQKPQVPKSQERSASGPRSTSKPYVPIHLRGTSNQRVSPQRSGVGQGLINKSPVPRVQRSSPGIPVQGNRFNVDYRGNRNLGGNSNSRDRVPKINSNYQRKDSPSTGNIFDRLYAQKPRSNSREPQPQPSTVPKKPSVPVQRPPQHTRPT